MMPITPTNTRPPHANYPAIQSPLQQSINLSTSNLGGSLGAGAGGDMSDISPGMRSSTGTPLEPRTSIALSVSSANERTGRSPNSIPAPQLAPRMLRMNSSPAAPDLVLDTSRTAASGPATALGLGLYPEQKYSDAGPGGGGSGSGATGPAFKLKRNKTFTCAEEYRGVRRKLPQHLAVDVEMCALVWDLRKRERELDERATDMQVSHTLATASFPFSPLIWLTHRPWSAQQSRPRKPSSTRATSAQRA
jgi:hypothetical protein